MTSLLGDLQVLSLLIDVPLFRQIFEIDERMEHAPPSRQSSAHGHAVIELARCHGGRLCNLREAGIPRVVLTRLEARILRHAEGRETGLARWHRSAACQQPG